MITMASILRWGNGAGGNGLLYLAALVAAATILLVLARRRRSGATLTPREQVRVKGERVREERAVQEDVREVLLELQNLARQINAQLDDKFQQMEILIRDADERINRLEALNGQGRLAGERTPILDVIVGEGGAAPASSGPEGREAGRRRAVWSLADKGRTPVEIARELGCPIGEVELMLALRSHKGAG